MENIISWLLKIERLANEAYNKAVFAFPENSELVKLLKVLADDEDGHYNVMIKASNYLESGANLPAMISIDEKTRNEIGEYFYLIEDGVKNHTLNQDQLIEYLVNAEISEWNGIFVYVVKTIGKAQPEIKYSAAEMQAHIEKIKYFIETHDKRKYLLDKLLNLPVVWIENILIVDDDETITELLGGLLERIGNIDIAHDGLEALKVLKEKYYKLIISDIDMPKMDGLAFYKEAVRQFPEMHNRFLFLTADLSDERTAYLKDNHIAFLEKPVQINTLKSEAQKMIRTIY